MRQFMLGTIATLAIALGASTGSADIVAQHLGQTDPASTSEGWTRNSNGAANSESTGSEAGVDYWQIATSGNFLNYQRTGTAVANAFADASGWTVTAKMKVISAASPDWAVTLGIDDGSSDWTFTFTDGSDTNVPAGVYHAYGQGTFGTYNHKQLTSSIDPTDGYHLYQAVLTPGATAAEDSVAYWIDGVKYATVTRADVPSVSLTRMYWGNNNSSNHGTARWAEVTFETGQHPREVPEPASLALLTMGRLLMLRRRSSQRAIA